MTLFAWARAELLLMWAVWLYPFLRKRFAGPNRKSNVMAHSSDWGLLLQTVAILLVWAEWRHAPIADLSRMLAAMLLAPAGTVCGWLAVRHLGKQLRILAGLYPDHELIRSGPYSVVRHPVYASLFLLTLATGLLLASWPVLAAAVALYIAGTEIRIHAEERLLASRFGHQFEEYRRQVPAYLPFIR
jgi:protein-S-isoprenylcysteine O-methyltransferase Ste14